jgi:hypothetical protein
MEPRASGQARRGLGVYVTFAGIGFPASYQCSTAIYLYYVEIVVVWYCSIFLAAEFRCR